MSKEQLINNLSSIEQFFKGKDIYEKDSIEFAEIYLGGRLLPYQKLMLRTLYLKENINTIISRALQKELNLTTKARLTYSISKAVNGEKVLFMSPKKNINKYVSYTERFIELNKSIFEENEITYSTDENVIRFNTGGSIEFN